MQTKSYTIVVTADGYAIMQTTISWRVDDAGECHIVNMSVHKIETLDGSANNYLDAEERLRGWYRAAAISMREFEPKGEGHATTI